MPIFDLLWSAAEQLNEDVARTGDRNDVAGLEHEAGLGLYDIVAPADALHKQPMVRHSASAAETHNPATREFSGNRYARNSNRRQAENRPAFVRSIP